MRKIKELEQKVDELSKLMKVNWEIVNSYEGSPPSRFFKQYSANQIDVLKALLDYLGLEIIEEDKKVIPISVKIVKKKKTKG